ncbi:glycoside hydrolase family 28 protein [Ferruginibacter albus]|uniref:glycoside hydrolase family 28 protein n=1 Tax=Ferruginibacter albus TaxID=2875540 RepID=UPI001CC46E31|nr:glycosyl hydrolase family 28 protein [Ferruginibacter albus]UAY53501.1 hypothetical protein K9M53_07450 [Ferruginibacter albus]
MKRLFQITLFCLSSATVLSQTYNILNYGAIGDGKVYNTKAIQAAIDECSQKGGQVIIPKGIFLTGTIYLKNNVTINLDKDAVIRGGSSFADYPDNKVSFPNYFTHFPDGRSRSNKALFFAEDVHNITFTGKGTIDGNGKSPEFNLGDETNSAKSWERPCGLLLVSCKKILVENIHLTSSAYWMQNYLNCEEVTLRGLNVYNHANHNNDGMDIDSRNVLIENCTIDSDDDGICFKSHSRYNICGNIIVRNCTIASNCNAIKFGTTSIGGFKNIFIYNCSIKKAAESPIFNWQKKWHGIDIPVSVISGLAIEATDGAAIDNIAVSNITMKDVQTPIFIRLANRGRKEVGDTAIAPVGSIKNIAISNINASSHSKMASSITAFPNHYIENIKLENISIKCLGAGNEEDTSIQLTENIAAYPENSMFGDTYPVSGFFIRHVKNIILNNVSLKLTNPDSRPAVAFDDVQGIKINKIISDLPQNKTPLIKLINCQQVSIDAPILKTNMSPLLQTCNTNKNEITLTHFKSYDGWLKECN